MVRNVRRQRKRRTKCTLIGTAVPGSPDCGSLYEVAMSSVNLFKICLFNIPLVSSLQIKIKLNMANLKKRIVKQVAFQSNANHPLAESMGYIKFEGI